MPTRSTETEPASRSQGTKWFEPPCQAAGCRQLARSRGYCPRHYQQWRRHGRLTPEREYQRCATKCSAERCERSPAAKGYCLRHYQQLRRYGHLLAEPQGMAKRPGRPALFP